MSAAYYRAVMAEAADILRQVSLPVDVTDADAFPNIAERQRHLASMSPELRAKHERDWL